MLEITKGASKTKKRITKQSENNKHVSPSLTTSNVNGLNFPIKRHGVAKHIFFKKTYVCYLHESHFRFKKILRRKVME